MAGQKGTTVDKGGGEDTMGKGSEGSAQIKEKTLEHSGVAEVGPGGRTEGPSLVGGGWVPTELGTLSYGDVACGMGAGGLRCQFSREKIRMGGFSRLRGTSTSTISRKARGWRRLE